METPSPPEDLARMGRNGSGSDGTMKERRPGDR
jgi:hypothetical protein